MPVFFHEHYNEEDLDIFEDIWANTLAGDVLDARAMHAMGEGIRPTFKLLRPRQIGDEDAQQKELEKYEPLLDELEIIDDKPRINFNENLHDSMLQAKVFGRAVLAFEPGEGKPPLSLKPIHPRHLGRVFIRQSDWSLSSVHTQTKLKQKTSEDEMIYLCNKRNSPRFNNMHYGYSDLQRVAGQSMALREITEFDIREIVKSMFAGYGIITVDQENLSEDEKRIDQRRILQNLKPGTFTVIGKQGDKDIDFNQFKFETDLSGLGILIDKCERMIIGHGQVPGALLGREEDSNMATLYGKIRMFLHGPVRSDRRWLANTVGKQWYESNLKFIDKDALKVVKVVPEFESLPMDAWMETIDGLMKLKKLVPGLPDEEILRLADLSHLANKINDDGTVMNPETLKQIVQETESMDLKDKLQHLLAQQP